MVSSADLSTFPERMTTLHNNFRRNVGASDMNELVGPHCTRHPSQFDLHSLIIRHICIFIIYTYVYIL